MYCETIIVGAGPAGIGCAIQLKHAGMDFLIIERNNTGGTLNNANLVENYPGLPSMSGKKLVEHLNNHMKRADISVVKDDVKKISESQNGLLRVETDSLNVQCRYLVIATGTVPRRIREFEIDGKSFYETRNMPAVEKKKVAVVGSGEAAMDSSLFLAERGNEVRVFTKLLSAKISKKLMDRIYKKNGIIIRKSEPVLEIKENERGLIAITKLGEYDADYLFISVGRIPNLESIESKEKLESDKIFLCGDVKWGRLGQAVMAVGDGVNVAQKIISMKGRDDI